MDRMTDEQLERLPAICEAQFITGMMPAQQLADILGLIAEAKRLRDLERACEALWRRHPDGRRYLAWQGAMSIEEQDAEATIGRLLEEKDG